MGKKQIKIPAFIWVIAVILVASILFIIFVSVPFSEQQPVYESNHTSATAQISVYEDYTNRANEVSAAIEDMKEEYNLKIEELSVNETTTAQDIRNMLKELDYDLSTLSVAAGVVDADGRTSTTGDLLYSTQINFTFTASYEKLLDTLDYFETVSDGSYYISSLTITQEEDQTTTTTSVDEDGSVTTTTTASLSDSSDNYTVSLVMNLYYFKDGTAAESSTDTSTESSAE